MSAALMCEMRMQEATLSRIREKRHKGGFSLIEVMFVIMLIGILLLIAIPSFTHARAKAHAKTCIKNLSLINVAKEQHAIEAKKDEGDAVSFDDLVPGYLRTVPECPADGTYTPMPIGDPPDCTIDGHEQ